MRKRSIFLLVILLITASIVTAQETEKPPVFIGLQPTGITKEAHYQAGEFDFNVIPIVFEFSLGLKVDLRFTTLVNYRFGPNPGIGDIGLNTVLPIYFNGKEIRSSRPVGLYAGPVLGVSDNSSRRYQTILLAGELGYMFANEKKFTLGMGLQIGASHFNYFDKENETVNHLGLKVNLGFWL